MPLISMSFYRFSVGAIQALAESVKPYGKGISIDVIPYHDSSENNLNRKTLLVLDKSHTSPILVQPSFKYDVAKASAFDQDVKAVVQVIDCTLQKLQASTLQHNLKPGILLAVAVSIRPDTANEFAMRSSQAVLNVRNTATLVAQPSISILSN